MEVGDVVIIKYKNNGDKAYDYPCGFLPEMEHYSGKIATIIRKRPLLNIYKTTKYWNEDPYHYLLNIDEGLFVWHSSMFYIDKIAILKDIF